MVDTIYVEEAVVAHPRSQQILSRYPRARCIEVENYRQLFNRKKQNFRQQKQNPSLILAAKHDKRIQTAPYETGGLRNYYFSHMLNCIYDCRYCFLQGMYRSANYLVFVNFEDFADDIHAVAKQHEKEAGKTWFYSGYDCDSLAFDPVTGFVDWGLSTFAQLPNAVLELRTKSTQIRQLLQQSPIENVVVAFSLSPDEVIEALEAGTPSLEKRLGAIAQLLDKGWRVGLRFDPIIWHQDYQVHYRRLCDVIKKRIAIDQLDSLTLGAFRLPKDFYKTMRQLYPEHWLFSAGLDSVQSLVSYRADIEQQILDFVYAEIETWLPDDKIFRYQQSSQDNIRQEVSI